MRRLACILSLLAAPALGQGVSGSQAGAPAVSRAAPPAANPAGLYPQVSGEADVRVFLQGVSSGKRRERGTNILTRAEIAGGLFLAPNLSVQSVIHVEPVGETRPNGASRRSGTRRPI